MKKGVSANPGGRRKTKLFHTALLQQIKEAGDDMKRLRKIAEQLLQLAEAGDLNAIKEVADRLDGKVPAENTLNVNTEMRPLAEMNGTELLERTADALERIDRIAERIKGEGKGANGSADVRQLN